MGDFFHGWRRKIGVVTLVITCVFAAGWVRSFGLTDLVHAAFSSQSCIFVESSEQTIGIGMERVNPVRTWHILPVWETTPSSGIKPLDNIQHFKWNAQWHDFGIGGNYEYYPDNLLLEAQAPYWFTVIPLTLLSAWLLLSKPRQRKSEKVQASTISN